MCRSRTPHSCCAISGELEFRTASGRARHTGPARGCPACYFAPRPVAHGAADRHDDQHHAHGGHGHALRRRRRQSQRRPGHDRNRRPPPRRRATASPPTSAAQPPRSFPGNKRRPAAGTLRSSRDRLRPINRDANPNSTLVGYTQDVLMLTTRSRDVPFTGRFNRHDDRIASRRSRLVHAADIQRPRSAAVS